MTDDIFKSDNPSDAWKSKLKLIEEYCPYPGPRPLRKLPDSDKPWRFVGRDILKEELLRKLHQGSFIIFHGRSGTGKSTFIDMALSRDMERQGYQVFIIDKYPQAIDPKTIYDSGILRCILNEDVELKHIFSKATKGYQGKRKDIGELLTKKYIGKSIVIFLDQFEEFIRAYEGYLNDVKNELISLNNRFPRIKLVLSFRSEYKFMLDDIRNNVNPYTFIEQQIDTIGSDHYAELIDYSEMPDYKQACEAAEKKNALKPLGPAVIDCNVKELLVRRLSDVQGKTKETNLIELHSVLYTLFWQAAIERLRESGYEYKNQEQVARMILEGAWEQAACKIEIKESDIDALAQAAKDGQSLFDIAVSKTIEIKIAHLKEVFRFLFREKSDVDYLPVEILFDNIDQMLQRIVPLLSVGDYKESKTTLGLLMQIYDTEFGKLERILDRAEKEKAIGIEGIYKTLERENNTLENILFRTSKELLQEAGISLEGCGNADDKCQMKLINEYKLDYLQWKSKDVLDDIASGMLYGMNNCQVIVEIIRTYLTLVAWMREIHIFRGSKELSLVHDKLGYALNRWREAEINKHSPTYYLSSFTSNVGDAFNLGKTSDIDNNFIGESVYRKKVTRGSNSYITRASKSDKGSTMLKMSSLSQGGFIYLVNLRWRSCDIRKVDFKNVCIVGADFRGTKFSSCTFEGVSFINCLLDGTVFYECVFLGEATKHLEKDSSEIINIAREDVDNILNQPVEKLKDDLEALKIKKIADRSIPSFIVRVGERTIRSLHYYRGIDSEPDISQADHRGWLYSPFPGVAAVPISSEAVNDRNEIQVASSIRIENLPTGGFNIFGGRITSLSVINCLFDERLIEEKRMENNPAKNASSMTIAYCAGSSVEFADQKNLDLKIYWSAIRSISFAKSTEDIEKARAGQANVEKDNNDDKNKADTHKSKKVVQLKDTFFLKVYQSQLANIWFSSFLSGIAEFTDESTCYGVSSLSNPARFKVRVDEGSKSGRSYNISEDKSKQAPIAGDGRWTEDTEKWFTAFSEKTDYISSPGRYYFEKIERKYAEDQDLQES